jgi:hypothetical protein
MAKANHADNLKQLFSKVKLLETPTFYGSTEPKTFSDLDLVQVPPLKILVSNFLNEHGVYDDENTPDMVRDLNFGNIKHKCLNRRDEAFYLPKHFPQNIPASKVQLFKDKNFHNLYNLLGIKAMPKSLFLKTIVTAEKFNDLTGKYTFLIFLGSNLYTRESQARFHRFCPR